MHFYLLHHWVMTKKHHRLLYGYTRIIEVHLFYALPLSAPLHKVAQSHVASLPVAPEGPIRSLAASPGPRGVDQVLR